MLTGAKLDLIKIKIRNTKKSENNLKIDLKAFNLRYFLYFVLAAQYKISRLI